MKITSIDVMKIYGKDAIPGWEPVMIRVYTDEGIYGDGEAALAYGTASNAAFGMIKDLAEHVIGMDPLDNEAVWDKMYLNSFWGQNGGPVVFAGISAIDIALWDIRGKYFNVPVYKLLGGKKRDNIRTYASQLQYGWSNEFETNYTVEDYVEASLKAVEEGFDCIKIDFLTYDEDGTLIPYEERYGKILSPHYLNLVERRLKAVRDAVGPNVDIIMENHAFIDTNGALQLSKIAEKYNVLIFEEPCNSDPRQTLRVKENTSVMISQGERLYSRWQYIPYFENGSVHMIQPDIGNCGGITEAKKICDMAFAYDISAQAHVCAGPVSTAAALQLEAVISNFTIHEHHVFARYPFNIQLGKYNYQPENGKFKIPDLPGLGNEHSEWLLNNAYKETVK